MATNQRPKWNDFVSLTWYDGFIEFLFRFVAKTSEPLLATGLIISAVDFLTKGALMRGSPLLTYAWAWTQAIAIEASSGVVFVYALQSFRQHDKIKAWMYLVLSILLAITGGAMLLFQLIATTTDLQEYSLPTGVFYALAGLRVLVSVSYVYLCRAKHISFTGLSIETHGTNTTVSEETMQQVLTNLAEFAQWKQQLANSNVPRLDAPSEDETESGTESLPLQLERLLSMAPDITVRDAATIVGKPPSTVGRHMTRLRQS